jgi:hypothetical protein
MERAKPQVSRRAAVNDMSASQLVGFYRNWYGWRVSKRRIRREHARNGLSDWKLR